MSVGAYGAMAEGLMDVDVWSRVGPVLAIVSLIVLSFLVRIATKRLAPKAATPQADITPIAVRMSELPACVARHFGKYDPAAAQLGFSHVGDFRLKHGGPPLFDRFYHAPESDVWIEMSMVALNLYGFHMPIMRTFGFASVFADGTYLCTVDTDVSKAQRPPQIICRSRVGLPPDQLYEAHCQEVDAYADEHATHTLIYPAEQIIHAAVYYANYHRQYRVSKAVVAPPPGYVTPTGQAVAQQPVGSVMQACGFRSPLQGSG